MKTTYTSPHTGIPYNLDVTEEYTDRCWLCEGSGTEMVETEGDKLMNEKAFDAWCDQDDDSDPPNDIRTGERPCTRCNATGKVPKEVGGVRINLSLSSNILVRPTA